MVTRLPLTVRSPETIRLSLNVVFPLSVAPLRSTVPVNVLFPVMDWLDVRVANAPEPAIEITLEATFDPASPNP